MQNQEIGKEGENLALDLLVKKGYKILERNWRHKNLEVDIIAQNNDCLIIVEVKTRSSRYLYEPYIAVNKQKQRNLIQAANYYLDEKYLDFEVQFDIISIVLSSQGNKIEHIENAFYPTVR